MKKIVLVSFFSFNLFASMQESLPLEKEVADLVNKADNLLAKVEALYTEKDILDKNICYDSPIQAWDNALETDSNIMRSVCQILVKLNKIDYKLTSPQFKGNQNCFEIRQKIETLLKDFYEDTSATIGEILPYSPNRNATSVVNNTNDDDQG